MSSISSAIYYTNVMAGHYVVGPIITSQGLMVDLPSEQCFLVNNYQIIRYYLLLLDILLLFVPLV